jgi:hypothetical protein
MRPERDSWVIGRVDTGDFILAPEVARCAITLLAEGRTVDEAKAALQADGHNVNVAGFVTTLADLGFLTHIDARAIPTPAPPPQTLPWVRPRHVRWLLHPATAVFAGGLVVIGALAMLIHPALIPGYSDLLWSRSGGAVLLGNAGIAWTIIFLHELAHLVTARAADIPGRMSLSTRLQFLAAQTDVSGVWSAPRRVRLTVYLAGIVVNLVIAAAGALAELAAAPTALIHRLLTATVLISLLTIPPQFLVFIRSDVYFVLQDVAGCANLYADGSAYARYQAARLWRLMWPSPAAPPTDPSRRLPVRERRAVRAYTFVLVAGTLGCLSVAATTTLPAAGTLLGRAVATLAGGASVGRTFDAGAVLGVLGGFQILWARAWWRRHGERIRRLRDRLGNHPRRTSERG